MDKQEARLLLQSYRPNGRDAGDPAFAEALALAKQDPELGEWFKQQCELDAAIGLRLQDAPVPVDLRQAIIAGQRSQSRIARPNFVWWKSPAFAWAAAIVLLFAVGFLFQGRSDGSANHVALAAYRDAMTANLRAGFVFDKRDTDSTHIVEWLSQHASVRNLEFPDSLKETIGCKLFEFEGRHPALVCFTLPDKEKVHLFVIDDPGFAESDFNTSACATQCNEFNTYAWRNEGRVFLLVGRIEADQLRELSGAPANPGQ